MPKLLLHTICFLCVTFAADTLRANSYAPPERPKVQFADAVRLASEFAAKHRKDIEQFYIDRVWYGEIPGEDKPCWIVSWACSTKGYYFVAVYMNGKARLPPKHRAVYSRNPFMEWRFAEPGKLPPWEHPTP